MKLRRLPELHIEGYKEMSIHSKPLEYLNPKCVYIPVSLVPNVEIKVKAGDQVLIGTVLANVNSRFPYPILSPVSGTVKGTVKKWHPSQKMVDCLEIENNSKEETVKDYKNLDPEKMDRQALVDLMKNAGLVGMGGAGFPAYAKYATTEKVETVIINLAECEPFITCDYTCVLTECKRLVYGLKYLLKAAGCNKGVIAIKDKPMNADIINLLNHFLEPNMSIHLLRDIYPAGWEKYTVEQVTNRTYKVLPIEAGAIVSNATTCVTFAKLLQEGVTPSEKYVTITGDQIKNPGNVLCKFGTPVEELLPLFGGLKEDANESNTRVVAGGPMTGKTMFFLNFITTQTLGAVICLKDKKSKDPQVGCLGCGRCADYCPTFLSPVEIKKTLQVGDMEELKAFGVTKCIQCGLCSFVCPSRIELTEAVGKAKQMVMALGRK